MEKLNVQKESMIEILRLIEEKMTEIQVSSIDHPEGTRIINFCIYFQVNDEGIKGDVYFGPMGSLKE